MLFFSHFLLPIVAKEFRKDKLQTSKNVTTFPQTKTPSRCSFALRMPHTPHLSCP